MVGLVPFSSKEWHPLKHRGHKLIGIKQHKTDKTRFYLEVNIMGVRKRKFIHVASVGEARKQDVIDMYGSFRADIREGYFLNSHTFDDMFNRSMSIKTMSKRWRSQQLAVYENHIKKHLGALNLQDIKPHHIDTVKAAIKSYAPATQKAIVDIVKSTLRHAQEDKIIKILPLEVRHNVKVIAAQQKTIVTNPQNKFLAVHEAIKKVFEHNLPMQAIFMFGLYGRRKSEVVNMKWQQIDFKNEKYMIPAKQSKVKIDFEFTLPHEIADILHKIKGQRKGLIFKNPNTKREYSNIQRYIEQIRSHSQWPGFTFHTMRNLLASVLHSRGVSASYISGVLGHTNPATVQQYLTMDRAQPIIEIEVNKVLHGEAKADSELERIELNNCQAKLVNEVNKIFTKGETVAGNR